MIYRFVTRASVEERITQVTFLWGQTREICQNIWGLSIVVECVLDLQRYVFKPLLNRKKTFPFYGDCSTFHREALMLHETASKTKWNKGTKKKTRVWKHCVHLFPSAVLIGAPFLLARTTKSWYTNYLLGCQEKNDVDASGCETWPRIKQSSGDVQDRT